MTTPNRKDLQAYLDMIFGFCEAGEENAAYCIALRGLGEKGTDKEGDFRDIQIIPPIQSSFDVDRIFGHVQRWSQHGRASFIVPACVAPAALSDKHATEERILLLTTIVVDIDTGNTDEKLAHAVKYLGTPTMVVSSGGTTDTGHAKVHSYWQLSEPSADVARIAEARKLLALKIGGDAAFGRSTQVIRIPGSVYNKGGVARPCFIQQSSTASYELDDLLDAINAMPVLDGVKVEASKVVGSLLPVLSAPQGGLNFSAFKDVKGDLKHEGKDFGALLTKDIKEGGDEDENRWTNFNVIAGNRIRDARDGRMTLEAARIDTMAWVETHMKPAWTPMHFETEWKGLVTRDFRNNGQMPGAALVPASNTTPSDAGPKKRLPLSYWAVENWASGAPPKPRFIVPGLLMAGAQHVLCAAGSVGKTYLMLDLILKIAMKQPGDGAMWMGQKLDDTEADGSAVLLTMEDGKDDIHRRIKSLCPDSDRLMQARGRAIVRPFISDGGAIRFLERQRGTQTAVPTVGWLEVLEELRAVPNLKLVVIDTLNSTMHDDENDSTVVNEYMQAVAPVVCGELGAALVITHHPRKSGQNGRSNIYTPRAYLDEMRGSGALAASFRAVLGIWDRPDYQRIMRLMGREPRAHQMFYFGVCKANPWGFLSPDDSHTALRNGIGLLEDVTSEANDVKASEDDIQQAWMVKAIEKAVEACSPFWTNGNKGVYSRRAQLPLALRELSREQMVKLIDKLVTAGLLHRAADGGLDIENGFLHRNEGPDGGAYLADAKATWKQPDWEREFLFDPIHFRVVTLADMHPVTRARMEKGRSGQNGNGRERPEQ